MALAWILRQPDIASALTGASKPAQIEDNVKASGIKLSAEVLQKIEEVLG
jgi:aryl-alcohol dehydrogenase-like predicted oxidoreductase